MNRRDFFMKGVGSFAIPLIITQIGCDNNPTNSEQNNNDDNSNDDNCTCIIVRR